MEHQHIVNFVGEDHESYFNAVAPPIIQTSNFCYNSVDDMAAALENELHVPVYTRGNNPTVEILRKKLAALEGTDDCLVTSSGCAAITAAVLSCVQSGDHIVSIKGAYSWTNHLFASMAPKWGIETTFVDGTEHNNFKRALRTNTRLIYLESPTSWMFDLQDLRKVSEMAKERGIITIIDNSYSTPVNQNPADLGTDLVVHSASKYLGGHSDLVAGVICGSSEKIAGIFRNEFMTFGGIISPFNAWLMIRGLRTLEIRLEKSRQNALEVIGYLQNEPKVERVIYPFLPDHPQYELAKKQMKAGNGLFTILLKTGDARKVKNFCNHLKLFRLAVSWGGYESLAFPAIATSGQKHENKNKLPVNAVRLYCGLEDPKAQVKDLQQALEKI